MVTQMAEQLVTEGHIDEWELQNMNLHQTRREIGLSLLSHSGKFGFVYMYIAILLLCYRGYEREMYNVCCH